MEMPHASITRSAVSSPKEPFFLVMRRMGYLLAMTSSMVLMPVSSTNFLVNMMLVMAWPRPPTMLRTSGQPPNWYSSLERS